MDGNGRVSGAIQQVQGTEEAGNLYQKRSGKLVYMRTLLEIHNKWAEKVGITKGAKRKR
jgi:hypothetical protein